MLPSVYQGAVEHYGWLTGPLIMVGTLGGVATAVFADPVAAGFAGATVATFFTFLPSFFFILAGAPTAGRGHAR